MINKTQLVIFDLDGVIMDSEPIHARSIQKVLQCYGMKPFDPSGNIGMSGEAMFAQLIAQNGIKATPEELVDRMTDYDEEEILSTGQGPTEGLIALLDTLEHAGICLGVASSSERRFVDLVLNHLGIRKRFRYTAAGSEAPHKKPAPDLYQRVLTLAHVDASYAGAIEDSPTGIQAAQQAGLFCVGYQNPLGDVPRLTTANAVVEYLPDAARYFR